MGWTGHFGVTAAEAIDYELQGCEILAKSGSWRLIRFDTGEQTKTTLVHCLTKRYGKEVTTKIVSATEGPFGTPPKAIFNKYITEVPEPDGTWDAIFRERVQAEHAEQKTTLGAGDAFTITAGYQPTWSDGAPIAGTYTFLGKFRARRYDGVTVRLPRGWRKEYDWTPGKTIDYGGD